MSEEPKYKAGDLWKLRYSIDSAFFSVALILEENVDGSVDIEELVLKETEILQVQGIDIYPKTDIKVEDPQEKAYWLLRFENARNKNE